MGFEPITSAFHFLFVILPQSSFRLAARFASNTNPTNANGPTVRIRKIVSMSDLFVSKCVILYSMERGSGLEPLISPWQGNVLPLN